MSRTRVGTVASVLVAVVFSLAATAASACPACKEAAAGQGGGLADGISYTVLGMIAMPWILFATFGFILYRAYRRRSGGTQPSIHADPIHIYHSDEVFLHEAH